MKLIYCPECKDIISLSLSVVVCTCGLSYGQYVDKSLVFISDTAIPMCISNDSFREGLKKVKNKNGKWATPLKAWVMRIENCKKVERYG